ncbi:MAG: sugar transferase [Candidatus Omnitrophota bacterium]
MKKVFENVISFFGEVKKAIGIYLAIQRYARISRKARIVFIFFGISLISLVTACYAQPNDNPLVIAPEPGSVALISTGFIGYMIGFARKRFREFKRIFDTILSAIGIVVVAPVIGFTALIIKIVSPGPVFYKQERVGWGGRFFNIYKMRTMRVDAEKITGPVWAQEDDPRLIKFGKIIRKFHIDELPQLFNVLRGDMSIVGPRPERSVFVRELSQKICDYEKRIDVRPGITGLAQVWHKYDETIADVRKKVKYDLLYIREMCLMVDIRIILRTVLVAARGKGAR